MSQGFEGFLRQYCQELFGLKTTSLKKMLVAAESDSPRVREPLLLLAVVEDREAFVMRYATGLSMQSEYDSFLGSYRDSKKSLTPFLSTLPKDNRFAKVYLAWKSKAGQLERDRQTLSNVAQSMNTLLQEKGLTRYEAARKLGVDKGNFYAFLKGDSACMSRDTAIKAYRQLATM